MPKINIGDKKERINWQQPQVGKKELLAPPDRPPRPKDPLAGLGNDDAWGWDALDSTEHAPVSFGESAASPVKRETGTGISSSNGNDLVERKRKYGGPHPNSIAAQKKTKIDGFVSQSSAPKGHRDRYGRKTGVIDLTANMSDSGDDVLAVSSRTLPTSVSGLPTRTPADPPPTFRRGLSPIAAHPRTPATVHRTRPPIRPKEFGSGHGHPKPEAAAPQRYEIFSSPAPRASASVTPAPSLPAYVPTEKKTAIPFLVEDSDEDENSAPQFLPPAPARHVSTPSRFAEDRVRIKEESKLMRAEAQDKREKEMQTRLARASGSDIDMEDSVKQQKTKKNTGMSFLGVPHQKTRMRE